MDVKTTFLHGDMKETILMQQPSDYGLQRKEDWVYHLKRSLHGLKHLPRKWYLMFDSFMLKQKHVINNFDIFFYLKQLPKSTYIYLLLYVNDMLITCKSMVEINQLKNQLKQDFEIKDHNATKKILGMKIIRFAEHEKLIISQEKCRGKVKRFKHG